LASLAEVDPRLAAIVLELVDMIDAEGDLAFGLVRVHAEAEVGRVDEASILHDAKSFQHVDYVLFFLVVIFLLILFLFGDLSWPFCRRSCFTLQSEV
jgi:hypothetical protein